MPQKIRIHLAGNPPPNPFQHSSGLRALLYGWLEQSSRTLAETVHNANQAKPFTISPISPNLDGNAECFFDISILSDRFSSPVLEGLSGGCKKIRLGHDAYAITKWEVIRQAGWEDLLKCGGYRKDFRFELRTPVAHHSTGHVRKSVVSPSPELYFGSWLNRWNLCCERSMPKEMADIAGGYLALSAFSGRTEALQLDKGRMFIGFVGDVKFSVLQADDLPREALVCLQALAEYAEYCGTGVDTSRGMGQTVYLE